MKSLESHVGHRFKKDRHGQKTVVTLIAVKRDKVQLQEQGHVDTFTLSKAKFIKFYKGI